MRTTSFLANQRKAFAHFEEKGVRTVHLEVLAVLSIMNGLGQVPGSKEVANKVGHQNQHVWKALGDCVQKGFVDRHQTAAAKVGKNKRGFGEKFVYSITSDGADVLDVFEKIITQYSKE